MNEAKIDVEERRKFRYKAGAFLVGVAGNHWSLTGKNQNLIVI